jgi:hypothetical protein
MKWEFVVVRTMVKIKDLVKTYQLEGIEVRARAAFRSRLSGCSLPSWGPQAAANRPSEPPRLSRPAHQDAGDRRIDVSA